MWTIFLRKELNPLETKPAMVFHHKNRLQYSPIDFTVLLPVVLSYISSDSCKSPQGTPQEFCLLSLSSAR